MLNFKKELLYSYFWWKLEKWIIENFGEIITKLSCEWMFWAGEDVDISIWSSKHTQVNGYRFILKIWTPQGDSLTGYTW